MRMKESGTTLIEVLISTGVLVIAILAATTYISSTYQMQKMTRLQQIRDGIANKVRMALTDPRAMFVSTRPTGVGLCPDCSAALRNCVYGVGPCVDAGAGFPFNLYQSFPEVADDITTDQMPFFQIAGGAGSAFRWTVNGEPGCPAVVPPATRDYDCPFVVETVFRPQGIVGGRAQAITSKFRIVDARSDAPASAAGSLNLRRRLLGPEPAWIRNSVADVSWRNDQWESGATIDVRKIHQYDANNCDLGRVVVGYTRFGEPICRCYQSDDGADNPAQPCSANCVGAGASLPSIQGFGYDQATGYTTVTGNPNQLEPSKLLCFPSRKMTTCNISGVVGGEYEKGCKEQQWLTEVEFGTCRYRSATKTEPEFVDCERNMGTCCQLESF